MPSSGDDWDDNDCTNLSCTNFIYWADGTGCPQCNCNHAERPPNYCETMNGWPDLCECWHYEYLKVWQVDRDKSNKLYKIQWDDINKTISRTLVADLEFTHNGNDGDYYQAGSVKFTGNLTFISRDVFLLTESDAPEWNGDYDTYRRVVVYANRLEEDGTVTPKIWSRVLVKEGQQDNPNNTTSTKDNYPGLVTGLTFVPPESEAFDEADDGSSIPNVGIASGNIVAITGQYPYGGPWAGSDNNQSHQTALWRLRSEDIDTHNNMYRDSDAWTDGADGTETATSAWTREKLWADELDFTEGWGCYDSKGNLFMGQAISWYNNESWPMFYGWCTVNDPIAVAPHNILGNPNCDSANYNCSFNFNNKDVVFPHDTMMYDKNGSLRVLHFHTIGTPGSWTDGLSDTELKNVPFGCTECEDDDCDGGNCTWSINHRHLLYAEGACCDIYGQTQWGKDTILAFVPRHNRFMSRMWGYDENREDTWHGWHTESGYGYNPPMAYNREGLYVMQMNSDSSSDHQMNILYQGGTDPNDNLTVCYTLDSSWGDDSATGEDAEGNADAGTIPYIEGLNGNYNNPFDWDDLSGSGSFFTENAYLASQWFESIENGLSFRPNSFL